MLIQYVGKKELKSDNVNNTGVIWTKLEVKEYPDNLAPALLKYTDIWEQVNSQSSIDEENDLLGEIKAPASNDIEALAVEDKAAAEDEAPPTLSALLVSLDKKGLISFAKQEGVGYSNTMNEDQLRAKLIKELSK